MPPARQPAQAIHIVAIVAGALTIFASAAPSLGLPPEVAQAVSVAVAILAYVANQLPTLGAS